MKNKIKFRLCSVAIFIILTNSCKKVDNNNTLPTIKDIDGNVYHIVTIGTQVWMVENLNVTHYRNGETIQNILIDSLWMRDTIGSYCNYFNKDSFGLIYGKLYNWYAINNPRNIAPTGWHVPTDAEWTVLINYLGGDSIAGGKMKEKGAKHWQNPIFIETTDESGFTALPGGRRDCNGHFPGEVGFRGYWWSSTGGGTYGSYYLWMVSPAPNVFRMDNCEQHGLSVRCIKDK